MKKVKSAFYKNKKAVLFTAMILLILGSILVATLSFVNRSEEISFMINSNLITYKILNIKSDIASDYFEIIGVNVTNISLDNDSAYLGLIYLLSSQKPDPAILLDEYKKYIDENFSIRTNINISLDFNNSFEVSPYNATFNINRTIVKAAFIPQSLKSIQISAYINDSIAYLGQSYSSKTPGATPVNVKIYDKYGGLLLSDNSLINIGSSNIYFVEMNSTIPYPRFYINISGNNLETYVTYNLSSAAAIYMAFNSTGKNKIYLNTGINSVFVPGMGGIVKGGPMELMSG